MSKWILRGGRVVDPANGRDGTFDVLIDGGRIACVGRDLPIDGDIKVVDVPSGLVVCPGLIDMHVHLREPGHEHKETVATGCAAAVAGGFTAVACMPNTNPVNDNAGVTGYILTRAAEANLARVYPIGAVSRGQQGEQLADIGELDAVRYGKSRGARVTCEVTPHHFILTDEMLGAPVAYDTNVKMNPPLREAADRDAMLAGIADGSVDAVATDHAPHHADEKHVEFDRAPFGITGLETAVSLCLDRLVHAGVVPLSRLVELLSVNPARILNVPGGSLAEGAPADLTILAPEMRVTISAAAMRSRSRNTPFDGWKLRGGVAATIVGGCAVYVNEQVSLQL